MLALAWALAVALSGGTPQHARKDATTPRAGVPQAVARQAKTMTRLVTRGDSAAVDYVVKAVRRGLPPAALAAVLDAARRHPHRAYGPMLLRLTQYRNASIRARAFLALTRLDESHARRAILKAMEDPELEIRLLALDLAEAHTTPELEEAAITLIDRDADVAAVVRRKRAAHRK